MIPDEEDRDSSCTGQNSPGTPHAPTGKRMALHEEASQYEREALQVMEAIVKDETQPNSLRLAAANALLNRTRGRPPVGKHTSLEGPTKIVVRWADSDDESD